MNSNLILLILFFSTVACGVKKPPVPEGSTPAAYEKYLKASEDIKKVKQKS